MTAHVRASVSHTTCFHCTEKINILLSEQSLENCFQSTSRILNCLSFTCWDLTQSGSWTVSRGLLQIFPLEATGILWEIGTAADRRLLCTNHSPALKGLGIALLRMDSGSSLFIYCSGRCQWSKKAVPWPPPQHCTRFIDKWHFLYEWLIWREPQCSVWRKISVPRRAPSWLLMNINQMFIVYNLFKLLLFKVSVHSLVCRVRSCSVMTVLKAQIKIG